MKIVSSVFLSMFVIDGVFGVDPDEVKTVIEGDSLTLQTDFTEMQKDGLTEWKVNNTNIATINKGTGKVEYSDDKLMMMFSGRLNLDQSGFLTIWNIRIKHSGEYKVESSSSVGTKSKTFKVTVKESPLKSVENKDEIKLLSVTKGNSETLHTETELQKHNLVLWRFGAEGSLTAKSDTEDNRTTYYDGDDGRFKGKLKLDSKTGSLTITDLETKHTGEFRLKIISNRRILFKRFIVTVSVLGLSPGAVAGICIVVLLVAAAAVAAGVMIYYRSNHYKVKKLTAKFSEQLKRMTKLSKQLEQMTKTNDKELDEFSKNLEKINEANVSENIKKELSEKLKQMSKGFKEKLPKLTEQVKQLREQNIPERLVEFSEQVKQTNETETSQQETRDDVSKEETSRPEIRESQRVRHIVVEETAISKAFGVDKILRDSQGRKSIAIRAEDDVHTQDLIDDVKISEQETHDDVTQEETVRPEIEEGEGERFMFVQETAISKAFGADIRLKDRQGKKSLVIRKANTEVAGVQTQEKDGKAPGNYQKEESTDKDVNEETPFMSEKEEDGPHE